MRDRTFESYEAAAEVMRLKVAEQQKRIAKLEHQLAEEVEKCKVDGESWVLLLQKAQARESKLREALKLLLADIRPVLNEPPERTIPTHHCVGDIEQARRALLAEVDK